jgi:glycosyltransferase involved in cell wall biosynthesis
VLREPEGDATMRMSLICCPFDTSYGEYGSSLKSAIERKTGGTMQWVGSNCGCGDAMEVSRQFITDQCDYFEMPILRDARSRTAWQREAAGAARTVVLYFRAKRYAELSKDAELVHFQQVVNATGSKAVFHWLRQPSTATRIVTVHELDADQLASPEKSEAYNRADAVIVHCDAMREQLIGLRVRPEKVHVVLSGTDIPERSQEKRDGIVFDGGHHIMTGKGLDTLFRAMSVIRQQRPLSVPTLTIHGHYGTVTPDAAMLLAKDFGIADRIVWRNQISNEEMIKLYQRSRVCVLPYTGGFAGLPASTAAACELPVVATRTAGLPDHLGESGIWVDENDADQLASRVLELLDNDEAWQQAAAGLRKRAEELLSWDVIAENTLQVYKQAIANRTIAAAR